LNAEYCFIIILHPSLNMYSLPPSYLKPSMLALQGQPFLIPLMVPASNANCSGYDNGLRNSAIILPSPLQQNNYSANNGFFEHRQRQYSNLQFIPTQMLPESVATANARQRKTRREGSVRMSESESESFERETNKRQPRTMREKQRAADENPVPADSFMASHKVSAAAEGAGDNQFDFVLLPSAVNARKGMKLAKPDTIACKYGYRCFRKDCRFFHPEKSPSALRVPEATPSSSLSCLTLPCTGYASPPSSSYRSIGNSGVSSPSTSPFPVSPLSSTPTSSPISTPRQGLSMYISPAVSHSSPELMRKESALN